MIICRSLEGIPFSSQASVVTIGNFDGVHCGHRVVLSEVISRARALNARAVAVTFDPHPARVLGKVTNLQLLTPLPEKLRLLAKTGIDLVLVLPFSEELSRWSARDFAARVLAAALRTSEVHEGETFRFGRGAETGIGGLAQLGEEFGFSVHAAQPYTLRGAAVSSSRVRTLITAGDVQHARTLLGRPFAVHSTPASGRGYGSVHTVPTINLAPYADILPAHGVYITTLRIENTHSSRTFQGVTNVGNRPTFGADSFAVESHLFEFEPVDLFEGTQLELTFLRRLREERRFETPAALKEQIVSDVKRAQRYFALAAALNVKLTD